jgi:hypothetical protein
MPRELARSRRRCQDPALAGERGIFLPRPIAAAFLGTARAVVLLPIVAPRLRARS